MDKNYEFVSEFANPHSWFLVAENLHEEAASLFRRRERSGVTVRRDANGKMLSQTYSVDRPAFLLCAFAIENVLKAFLVYENPQWVSNGILSRQLRSHALIDLHNASRSTPKNPEFIETLAIFENGIESWFRYPCGLTMVETVEQQQFQTDVWDRYSDLMAAYSDRLRVALDKLWKGPHGFSGRWDIQGEFLGSITPMSEESAEN